MALSRSVTGAPLRAESPAASTMLEPEPAPVVVDGVAFDHLIPSRLDCRTCHEAAPVPVLGFDELGLGPDQLAALAADGVLAGAPPGPPAEIDAATALERDVRRGGFSRRLLRR